MGSRNRLVRDSTASATNSPIHAARRVAPGSNICAHQDEARFVRIDHLASHFAELGEADGQRQGKHGCQRGVAAKPLAQLGVNSPVSRLVRRQWVVDWLRHCVCA
jgi:hypothetical protein